MISPATIFHIAAGAIALISAPVALMATKGSLLHRRAGMAFTLAMAAMALSGTALGYLRGDRATGTVGLLTLYLIATAWLAAQPKRANKSASLGIAAGASAALAAGFFAVALFDPKPVLQPIVPLVFGLFASIALLCDLWRLARPELSEPGRIARHLWRMMLALILASASFFLGQQKVFPAEIKGWAIWYAPPLLALLGLAYWMIKTRLAPVLARKKTTQTKAAHP